ncbi:RNA pseudouridine synthase [Clostridium tetani]|nr:RNA pseudouridine synthase [Clostridium tetani]RXM78437.1 RNA pseudouridine synthase [Clostridium tetani]RYU99963.1 RNA pseudouridine synthase [Clostridium tetani]
MDMKIEKFLVKEEFENERLDLFIVENLKDKSRSFIKKLSDDKGIMVNDEIKKVNYKVKCGDIVKVLLPKEEGIYLEKENMDLNILYEDEDIIVINKPQGMVVHPGVGNTKGTLVNGLLAHCKSLSNINGEERPGIVHRIDKDTSGILVIAKTNRAHEHLANQLKNHSMLRVYMALTEGVIKEDMGTIDKDLGRNPSDRIKFAVVDEGKRAVTHYKVINRYNNNSLIECRLETGRTHQIRVHMSYIGHPIVGDPVYGYKRQKFKLKGQMLHAKKLGFIHPTKEEYMEFNSEIPEEFKKILEILEKQLK